MAIPFGIQVLLKKAAVDAEFRELLLLRRSGAAAEIDLVLHDSEKQVLDDVSASQLAKMIDLTEVPTRERPVFAGKAIIPMLAVVGVATGGCAMGHRVDRETRPRYPEPKPEDVEEVTPTAEDGQGEPEPKDPPVSRGIQPDRPAPKDQE